MFSQRITRRLIVSVDPIEQRAAVELHGAGHPLPYAVTAGPDPAGGWLVADACDPEPTWRATFPEAIGEAIARAGDMLEDQLVRALLRAEAGRATPALSGAADIC